MARLTHSTCRLIAILGLIATSTILHAQAPAPYTLHAYASLIQIPTLILGTDLKPLPPIPLKDFRISLDSGPKFLPSKIHMEGDDPLNLAILLDASGGEEALLKDFADSIASLAPTELHPQDHFQVYAVDCALVGTAPDIPASPQALRTTVNSVLNHPKLHGKHSRPACGAEVRLWDAVAHAIQQLSTLPGRRVLLIVSAGADHQSHVSWSNINTFAALKSVAIFGMNDFFNFQPSSNIMQQFLRNGISSSVHLTGDDEDPYQALCESNGGILFGTQPKDLTQELQSFLRMLRGRYLLEFPRGNSIVTGFHSINVTVEKKQDIFIVVTGVTVARPDEKILTDPTTVPSAPSQITYGSHRPSIPRQ